MAGAGWELSVVTWQEFGIRKLADYPVLVNLLIFSEGNLKFSGCRKSICLSSYLVLLEKLPLLQIGTPQIAKCIAIQLVSSSSTLN